MIIITAVIYYLGASRITQYNTWAGYAGLRLTSTTVAGVTLLNALVVNTEGFTQNIVKPGSLNTEITDQIPFITQEIFDLISIYIHQHSNYK